MTDLEKRPIAREADDCEVYSFDPERVARARKAIEGTEGLSLLFKALADDTRVRIALALSREELCVCDVATLMEISVATASHHLRLLRNMGLAKFRKEGRMVYYSLEDDHVVTLLHQAIAHYKEGKHA